MESGRHQKNQRSRNDNTMRKRIIQLQTETMDFTLPFKTDMRFFLLLGDCKIVEFPAVGNRIPVSIDENIWITNIQNAAVLLEKKNAIIPNINEGPALLQKPSNLSASFLLSAPEL